MKKFLSFILIIFVVMSTSAMLFSCSEEEETDGTTDTTATKDEHTHQYATEWESTANGHYKPCTCHPDVKNIVAHMDLVDLDGLCDVCFYVISEPKTFTVTVVTADGAPIKGVKIKIYDSAYSKVVTTDENGQASADVVYPNGLRAIVQSAPDGYESIVDRLYSFSTNELVITAN